MASMARPASSRAVSADEIVRLHNELHSRAVKLGLATSTVSALPGGATTVPVGPSAAIPGGRGQTRRSSTAFAGLEMTTPREATPFATMGASGAMLIASRLKERAVRARTSRTHLRLTPPNDYQPPIGIPVRELLAKVYNYKRDSTLRDLIIYLVYVLVFVGVVNHVIDSPVSEADGKGWPSVLACVAARVHGLSCQH